MITSQESQAARLKAARMIEQSGVAVRPEELENIETADFGLGEYETTGSGILTLVDTGRIMAKLLVLFPGQTLPEHTHRPVEDYPGKEETLRCAWGECYLYVPGEPAANPACQPPAHRRAEYHVWHEIALQPGEQATITPGTPHWFQGGAQGAVVWSITTRAMDAKDVFSDPDVSRRTVIQN